MIHDVVMPKLGLTMVEGTLVKWLRKEGQEVEKGQPLFQVETEKVEMEIEAEVTGILRKIFISEGGTVPVGARIGIVEEAEGSLSLEKPVAEIPASQLEAIPSLPKSRVAPLSESRKTIAQRMVASLKSSAQLTIMTDADATQLKDYRHDMKAAIGTRELDITYTDLVVVAVTKALQEHPILNSILREEGVEIFEKVDMGLAVTTEKGLLVPVIRDVQGKSLQQVAESRQQLVDKTREGRLTVEDTEGGTFTITNLGMYGIGYFTPIINPPQSAIIGVGAIVEKPSVADGQISIRWMMPLSLTFDHRVVDGYEASQFLMRVRAILENPHAMF